MEQYLNPNNSGSSQLHTIDNNSLLRQDVMQMINNKYAN